MATYANEKEIDDARGRELKRVQDGLARTSAGLAKSKSDDDKRKLDSLMEQARKETDEINKKFAAQKARYIELKAATAAPAAPAAPKVTASK